MNKNAQSKINIVGGVPLRGSVALQSSPEITLFLITLSLLLGKRTHLTGVFTSPIVLDFINNLKAMGFGVSVDANDIYTQDFAGTTDSNFFSKLNLSTGLTLLLCLSKRGFVEISNNDELVNFFKYLGFVVDQKGKAFTIHNKVSKARNSITFHSVNIDYYYFSMIALLLNNDKFSISSVDLRYEHNFLLSILKESGLVSDINYSNFIKVDFDFVDVPLNLFEKQAVPGDVKEFVFFAGAAIATLGEVEIKGLDPKDLAPTLKIYSKLGIGFESVSDSSFKVWMSNREIKQDVVLDEESLFLNYTKASLLPFMVTAPRAEGVQVSIVMESKLVNSVLRDLNIYGAGLEFTENLIISKQPGKIKKANLYLEKDSTRQNYIKVISACTGDSADINDIDNLLYYNRQIFNKLEALGARITYDFTE